MLQDFTGEWHDSGNTVQMNLPIMFFEDEGVCIAYIPVLDLSGYGKTEQEASDSLFVVIDEYFKYGTRKKTLVEDLKAHGWVIKKKSKPYIAPEITDLINKNEYLHDIVNSRSYSMKRVQVNVPQFA